TARFSGKVSMSEIRPLEGYTLNFEGSGGAAGFAKGSATIRLQDEGDQTLLTYNAKASIGGKLGQLGSRLIEGSAKKLSAEFFSVFASVVGSAQSADASEVDRSDNSDASFKTIQRLDPNFLRLLFFGLVALALAIFVSQWLIC
ncbi:MAG: hypothetical protein FJY58_10500, partial [Betaproteobacteria bacterium]|nr:hypothetical protein [Betaproteobacteria bacterium]